MPNDKTTERPCRHDLRDEDLLHESMIRDRRRLAPGHWSNSDIDCLLRMLDRLRERAKRWPHQKVRTVVQEELERGWEMAEQALDF